MWRYLVVIPITLGRRLRRKVFRIREWNLLTYPLGDSAVAIPVGEAHVEALTSMTEPLRRFCLARYHRWSDDADAAIRSYERRFARGDVCFALMEEDEITCHVWGSERTLAESELERHVTLRAEEVALYDIYVLPGHRGGGRYPQVFPHFVRYYRARGKTAIQMVIDGDNEASFRSNRRIGFRRVTFRLWQVNLLGFSLSVHRQVSLDVDEVLGGSFCGASIAWDVIRGRCPARRAEMPRTQVRS